MSFNQLGGRNFSPEHLIGLLEAQQVLFSATPSRTSLRSLSLDQIPAGQSVTVNVWRNHSFEPLLPLVEPYFAYSDTGADFCLFDYDDSLSFLEWQHADVELLWLDPMRYLSKNSLEEWLKWLGGRVLNLREISPAPIVIATWFPGGSEDLLSQGLSSAPGVFVANLESIAREANQPLTDESALSFSGTRLNPKLHIPLARSMACHWLPGAVSPPLKAVFVDLDNTLYEGILGEDGPEGLTITPGHHALQRELAALRDRGVFLGLTSKNRLEDVEKLFEVRGDFPLGLEDFSIVDVSWEEKHLAISRGLGQLGIGSDATIFVDDNPGEIMSVARVLPDIRTVHATADGHLTARTLLYTPGLWRWGVVEEDLKRIDDQRANIARTAILSEVRDPHEYLESLGIRLTFHVNPRQKAARLSDLSLKTNQFNLSFLRLNQSDVLKYMEPNHVAVAVSLEDRLSDSGVIAMVLIRFDSFTAFVDEVTVSCRALGRQLEDAVVIGAIKVAVMQTDTTKVSFVPMEGPRNAPALTWLKSLEPNMSEGKAIIGVERVSLFDFPEGVGFALEGDA